jgi:hypothetical protein
MLLPQIPADPAAPLLRGRGLLGLAAADSA